MAQKKNVAWDDESNEATNSFVGFNEIGDYILGTLVGKKKVQSTLPDKAGEMQNIYIVKVKECKYHVLDERKRIVEEPIACEEGDIVSVGGRKVIDSRMERVKIGQVFGLKFKQELPPKTKGYNPTKLITVYLPKNEDGTPQMDQEWIDSQSNDDMNFEAEAAKM